MNNHEDYYSHLADNDTHHGTRRRPLVGRGVDYTCRRPDGTTERWVMPMPVERAAAHPRDLGYGILDHSVCPMTTDMHRDADDVGMPFFNLLMYGC